MNDMILGREKSFYSFADCLPYYPIYSFIACFLKTRYMCVDYYGVSTIGTSDYFFSYPNTWMVNLICGLIVSGAFVLSTKPFLVF